MASRIITKKGSGAPLASDLVHGELAVDTVNKRLYTENAGGTIIELGTAPSTIDINAGTIDGTVIGGSSAAAGTFTSITGTSANINGTVTADGLTVEGTASATQLNILDDTASTVEASWTHTDGSGTSVINVGRDSTWGGELIIQTDTKNRANFASNGDISFYEDTGTTAKFYWDASAESLGIGTTSPASALDVAGTVTADGLTLDFNQDLQVGGTTYPFSISKASAGSLPVTFKDTNDAANASVSFVMRAGSANERTALKMDGNNDISFYEDTGTTAKFFWDASAESLGIGTTSPAAKLEIGGAGKGIILASPDGTRYKITVANGGILIVTAV